MSVIDTAFTRAAGIEVPLICGAMYPCSNPELVAAVSEAGGLGIIQPISLTYVHGHDFREGLRATSSAASPAPPRRPRRSRPDARPRKKTLLTQREQGEQRTASDSPDPSVPPVPSE